MHADPDVEQGHVSHLAAYQRLNHRTARLSGGLERLHGYERYSAGMISQNLVVCLI